MKRVLKMVNESSNNLVVVAKTWLQRDEQFPIDFNEIWERAGYEHRHHAVRAFEACIVNFGLIEGKDHLPLKVSRPNGGGR